MSRVFVIAEAACTWLFGDKPLENAYRSIRAAKECDADAWKTQWTSDFAAMHERRKVAGDHYKRLAWPAEWLPLLKAECDRVGIEFMCTVFVPKDIATIAPLVKRFKVSAFEGSDEEFLRAHSIYGKRVIVSVNPEKRYPEVSGLTPIHCVSKYPCDDADLRIDIVRLCFGFSDHGMSTMSGAVAVGAGAQIIEHHVRLDDTPKADPDYGHSFRMGGTGDNEYFDTYVGNIRSAEEML